MSAYDQPSTSYPSNDDLPPAQPEFGAPPSDDAHDSRERAYGSVEPLRDELAADGVEGGVVPRYEPPQRRASRSPFPEGGRRDREDYGSSARRERSPPPARPSHHVPPPRSEVLGVFGLSIRTTEAALHDEFSRHGRVEKVTIVYDARSDRSRGFGFIAMASPEDAEECIKHLNGLELNGRRIRVDFSMTHKPHNPTPGEYRGEKRPDFDDRRGPSSYDRPYRPAYRDSYGSSRGDDRDYRGGGDRYGGGGSRYGGGDRYEPRDGGRDYRDSRPSYDDYRGPSSSSRRYDDRDDRPPYRSRSPVRERDAYSSSRRSPSPVGRRAYSPDDRDRRGGSRAREELDAPRGDDAPVSVRW